MRFGKRTELLAGLAADVDPIFRRDFEEIDRRRPTIACAEEFLQRADQGPPQSKSRAVNSAAGFHLSGCKSLPCPSSHPSRNLPCLSSRPSRSLPCLSSRPSKNLPCPCD